MQQYSNAWMPSAGLALSMASGQLGFGLADTFVRLEDPPYNAGPASDHPLQQPGVRELRWAPGGGRLTGTLRYTNMIDVLQGDFSYATSMTNALMLDASWKWLPKTAIFLNVTQGYRDVPARSRRRKEPSYPLRVTAGLRGLLTEKTSVAARARLCERVLLVGRRARAASWAAPSRICRSRCGRRCSAGWCSGIATTSRTRSSAISTTARRCTRRTCSRSPAAWRWICPGVTSTRTTRACLDPTTLDADGQLLPGRRDARLLRAQLDLRRHRLCVARQPQRRGLDGSDRTSTTRSSRCLFASDSRIRTFAS